MVLKPEDFTEKAQEAMADSQEIVRRYHHSQWDVEHVLLALLGQVEGVPVQILTNLNVPVETLRERLNQDLVGGPKLEQESNQIFMTPRSFKKRQFRIKIPTQRVNSHIRYVLHMYVFTKNTVLFLRKQTY